MRTDKFLTDSLSFGKLAVWEDSLRAPTDHVLMWLPKAYW